MNGAKRTAEIQAGMKRTSASDKREGLRDKRKRQADNLTQKIVSALLKTRKQNGQAQATSSL